MSESSPADPNGQSSVDPKSHDQVEASTPSILTEGLPGKFPKDSQDYQSSYPRNGDGGERGTFLVRKKLPWLQDQASRSTLGRDQLTPDTSTASDGRADAHSEGSAIVPPVEDPKKTKEVLSDSLPQTPVQLAQQSPSPIPRAPSEAVNRPRPLAFLNEWLTNELDLPVTDRPSPSRTPSVLRRMSRSQTGGLKSNRATDHSRNRQSISQEKEIELKDMSPRPKGNASPGVGSNPSYGNWDPDRPTPSLRKRPTLHALPPHLMGSSGSESFRTVSGPPGQRPENAKQSFAHSSGSLNRAVNGLENLMGEAINVARDAAQSGRPDEVAEVLNSATMALRKASMLSHELKRPKRASSSESNRSSGSDSMHDRESTMNGKPSADTLPTVFTNSGKSSMEPMKAATASPTGGAQRKSTLPRTTSEAESISLTPPHLYQPASVESMVRDFAYRKMPGRSSSARSGPKATRFGEAADYYGDQGESVQTQPGVRKSLPNFNKPLPSLPAAAHGRTTEGRTQRRRLDRDRSGQRDLSSEDDSTPHGGAAISRGRKARRKPAKAGDGLRELDPTPTMAMPERTSTFPTALPTFGNHHHHGFFHRSPSPTSPRNREAAAESQTQEAMQNNNGGKVESRYEEHANSATDENNASKLERYSGPPPPVTSGNLSLKHPRRNHISLNEGEGFSLGRYHRRRPIARE